MDEQYKQLEDLLVRDAVTGELKPFLNPEQRRFYERIQALREEARAKGIPFTVYPRTLRDRMRWHG